MNPFTPHTKGSVGALGEAALIRKIRTWLGDTTPPSPRGIGDDCAVFEKAAREQVITVDPVIYGRHFDAAVSPGKVGGKLLKRNLSDLAAMGAKPTVAVVALSLPSRVSEKWIQGFYKGLARAARKYGVAVVGGDISQSTTDLVASLTLVGQAAGKRLLCRGRGAAGDFLYVTGQLGGSLSGKHTDFEPRLAEGEWLAGRAEVKSMMDVSDGIAKDAQALARKGTRVMVSLEDLPVSAAAKRFSRRTGKPAHEHALTDGEDYELLFAVDARADLKAFEKAWTRAFPLPFTRIGVFTRSAKTPAGFTDLTRFKGYEHLR